MFLLKSIWEIDVLSQNEKIANFQGVEYFLEIHFKHHLIRLPPMIWLKNITS